MTTRSLTLRRTALAALAVLAFAAVAPAAETAAQSYTANLVNDDPRQGRKIETLQIEIARLSTPEELAALATADAKKAEEIGSAKLDRTTSRAAVAAVETNGASGRKLTVVFEQPLNWFEGSRNPSAKKHPYGVLEIELDGAGKGQGKLIAGAQVKFGANGIEVSNPASEMKVINVAAAQG